MTGERPPASRAEISVLQSQRKRAAFERAKGAAWYRGKLDHIDPDRLDDPGEWCKIPILDKETLRQWSHDEFLEQICIADKTQISEYWRSGGSTGKPVFYPRTFEDVTQALHSWGRTYDCIGIYPGDLCHISFPIGIHPAGQIWARSAHQAGVGMNWVGAGNAVPSRAQLDLIQTLKPTVLISMPGFAIHLANLAETEGIDLRAGSVRKIVCSAEPLSASKRKI
jgi:phenylacetate-CoA ligase